MTFAIAFGVFLIVIVAMAIGVMVSGKRLQGSCGGIGSAMNNERGHKVCGYCGRSYEQQKVEGCNERSAKYIEKSKRSGT